MNAKLFTRRGIAPRVVAALVWLSLGWGSGAAADSSLAIGQMKTRNYLVTFHQGKEASDSIRYSVENRNGEVLHRDLDLDQLRYFYPDLAELLEQGAADDASLYPKQFDEPGPSDY